MTFMHGLLAASLMAVPSAAKASAGPQNTGKIVLLAGGPNATFSGKPDPNLFPTLGDTERSPAVRAQLMAGNVNATPYLNAALSAGSVRVPCGTYRFDTPPAAIPAGRVLRGSGRDCAIFEVNYADGDFLVSSSATWVLVEGLKIMGTVSHASGAMVRFSGTYGATVRDVVIDGQRHDDIVLDHTNTTKVLDSDVRPGAVGAGLVLTGYAVDTFVSHTNFSGTAGLRIRYASGIYLDNLDIVGSSSDGIVVAPGPGQNVNALYATAVLSDSSVGSNWVFGGVGPITETFLSSSWASGSASGSGLVVRNQAVDGLTLTSFHAHHNAKCGVDVEAGRNIGITSGTHVIMNSVAAPHVYSGIAISAGVSDVTIEGVFAGRGGFMADQAGLPNLQAYGLYIAPGNGDRIIVANNNLTGNATGGALVGATGQTVYVTNNIGYRTVSSGTSSVAAGKTSITIRHGLDAPAAAISVQVTPAANWGERRFWVTTTQSGDFTVSATSSATVALPFRWRASAFGN